MASSTNPSSIQDNAISFSIQDSRTVAAIVILGVIMLVVTVSVGIEKLWKKRLRDILSRKKNGRPNKWFRFKRWTLLVFLLILNIGAIVAIYLFGNQRATLAIVIIGKVKDIMCVIILPFYYVYKICSRYDAKRPILDGKEKTIVPIIPVYNETLEEIIYTMDSIIHNSIKMYQMLVVIVCDGHIPEVDSLVDIKLAVESNLKYRSWKGADVGCEVVYGYRGKTPLVIIKKDRNMEKKDSLILAYDVFNQPRTNAVPSCIIFRIAIIEQIKLLFHIDKYDYMFFTDADSFILVGSLTNLIDELEYRKVAAACGLVMVDFGGRRGGFWNIYQNFQYVYGQYVRRNTENIIARVTCLPGCITMVKVDRRLVGVISDYATMPPETDLIHTTVQRLGTDRRLTHLFQVHQLKTCMVDSAVCYTKPPQNWYRLLAQRRRWGSNAFFNSSLNFWSKKIHPIIRLSSFLDLVKMSLVVFRFFNIGLCMYQLIYHIELAFLFMQLPLIVYPPLYFFLFSLFKKRIRLILPKILAGFMINTFLAGFFSVGIMATVFYNIGNFSWGPGNTDAQKKGQSFNVYAIPLNQVPTMQVPVAIVILENNNT
jgi:cellulose synthase/poly-beta-1,6-N-acetylglucosamine synthase-like glycosyltransferase